MSCFYYHLRVCCWRCCRVPGKTVNTIQAANIETSAVCSKQKTERERRRRQNGGKKEEKKAKTEGTKDGR